VNTGTIYKCGPEKTKTEKHRRQARKLTESVEVVNRSLSRSASLSNIEIVVKEGNAGSENDLRESTLIDMIKRKKPVLAHRGVGAHFVEAVGDVGRLVIRQVNLAERVSLVISTAVTMRVVRDVAGQAGHDLRFVSQQCLYEHSSGGERPHRVEHALKSHVSGMAHLLRDKLEVKSNK